MNVDSAYKILNDRLAEGGESNEPPADPNAQTGGQTIDIGSLESTGEQCESTGEQCETDPPSQFATQFTNATSSASASSDKDSLEKLVTSLAPLTVPELIRSALLAQEERVETYKVYEQKLRECIQTGNLGNYPIYSGHATAQFAVLSRGVRAVRSVLGSRNFGAAGASIDKIQALEQEKLRVVAALHLEEIRKACEEDDVVKRKLERAVLEYNAKLREIEEGVQEEIDELRGELM